LPYHEDVVGRLLAFGVSVELTAFLVQYLMQMTKLSKNSPEICASLKGRRPIARHYSMRSVAP